MTTDLRAAIRRATLGDDRALMSALVRDANLSASVRFAASVDAAALVNAVRDSSDPGAMESFLAEYGLSTDEGVALMCLAEALLRVPDDATVDELIRDKIAPHDWGSHIGDSGSILINASTWALMLTGKVLDDDDPGVVGTLQAVVRRLGEPVVRAAVKRAMQELGAQFVLGEDIARATTNGDAMRALGFTYSYDMLGEAARTAPDARRYFDAYAAAIDALAQRAGSGDIANNPGISVKLSALHPRYETMKSATCVAELSERLLTLSRQAAKAGLGLNLDAEEADRLDMSLDIVQSVLSDESLAGWDGFGVVVQAYGKRAGPVIDWLYDLAQRLDRRIMVRLVKGAYWDTEIKLAQTLGVDNYPVFRRKADTDVSYICCAQRLLSMRDRIYPQFATHNAHTIAAVLQMAGDRTDDFEFQRLHGMGGALHDIVLRTRSTRCRIYAPVGAHEDLLAYLVRRLLENGANSSFVNQIVDESVSAEEIASDPFKRSTDSLPDLPSVLPPPPDLFMPWRRNSKGWNIGDLNDLTRLGRLRKPFQVPHVFGRSLAGETNAVVVGNPARPEEKVGYIVPTHAAQIDPMITSSLDAQPNWEAMAIPDRAATLIRCADLFEANTGEAIALLAREAGKTLVDAISEIREAVDFLRYYASQVTEVDSQREARGVIVCISPWNFPLAIFSGQVAAALVTGNTVLAKPAEQTPLIASWAVALFHEAGVPGPVLQLALGDGPTIGAPLTADPRISGVCFTGSTNVARLIEAQLAKTATPDAMLIAETGGLNAMIVDSTALTEQAVRDIVTGAFQSAGQRCSALRIVYVQHEKMEALLTMVRGAMDELVVGDPEDIATDVGPAINGEAKAGIDDYCASMQAAGKIIKSLDVPRTGQFVAPTIVRVDGIADLDTEIFGPVLHVAGFDAADIDQVVADINARDYGLTFGLHSRIDERVQRVISRVRVGNVYVNRNQIGAVVGLQPFGGEGLSGTGPKAGGPYYLSRFTRPTRVRSAGESATVDAGQSIRHGQDKDGVSRVSTHVIDDAFARFEPSEWPTTKNRIGILRSVLRGRAPRAMAATAALDMSATELVGPTGESNRLSLHALGRVLCLSEDPDVMLAHVVQALRAGNTVVAIAPGARSAVSLLQAPGLPLTVLDGRVQAGEVAKAGLDAVAIDASETASSESVAFARELRQALAERDDRQPLVRLITGHIDPLRFMIERAVCIDTTAAGGNTQLLAAT